MPQRSALRRRLRVSPKTLTQMLRRLEDFGILDRAIYPAAPPRTLSTPSPPSGRAP
ncbi:winged helix-turn-helix transcriptional regulator [Streptomyces cucumeris]|uniref:winged helix-turn-helix transcriptional regulator n=1 Tax=Streptomyces cucumeris TaxID=2962890 RepID=UPI003D70F840